MLTPTRAAELLAYNPRTGELIWRALNSKNYTSRIGEIAGVVTRKGYRLICIDGKRYLAHRVIWLMAHGKWPIRHLDHVNGRKDDNRLENLREATDSQNKANGSAYRNNGIGIKGAYYEPWRTSPKKWRAAIRKDGKLKHLGYFLTPEEANEAYFKAALSLHGEFARAA